MPNSDLPNCVQLVAGDTTGLPRRSPAPNFDRIVGLGAWWLAENKPHYSMSEGLHLACSAAAAVCAEPHDALAAMQLALADPDEVFDGSLDADEIRGLICTIHPAHQAADIP